MLATKPAGRCPYEQSIIIITGREWRVCNNRDYQSTSLIGNGFVLVLDVHVGSVVVDLLIHTCLDLLDRHLGGQADIEFVSFGEVKVCHVADSVENAMLDSLIDSHPFSRVEN